MNYMTFNGVRIPIGRTPHLIVACGFSSPEDVTRVARKCSSVEPRLTVDDDLVAYLKTH